MITAGDIVGAWALRRFSIQTDGRPEIFPFGEDAQGMLTYTESGHMSAILSRRGRPPLGVGRLENAGRAAERQRAEAFNSYLSYAGTWRVEEDRVVHVVTLSLTPDAVGTENIRRARLHSGQLTLSYEIVPLSGRRRIYKLCWERLRP